MPKTTMSKGVVPFSVWVSDNPRSFQEGVAGKIIEAGGKPKGSFFYLDGVTFKYVTDQKDDRYADRLQERGISLRNIEDLYADIIRSGPSALRNGCKEARDASSVERTKKLMDAMADKNPRNLQEMRAEIRSESSALRDKEAKSHSSVSSVIESAKQSIDTFIKNKKFAQASDMIRTLVAFDPIHEDQKVLYTDADMKFAVGATKQDIASVAPELLPHGAQFISTFHSRKHMGAQSMQTRDRTLDVLFDKGKNPKSTVTINNGAFLADYNSSTMARIVLDQVKNAEKAMLPEISTDGKDQKASRFEILCKTPIEMLEIARLHAANPEVLNSLGIPDNVHKHLFDHKTSKEYAAQEVEKYLSRHITSSISIIPIAEEVKRGFESQQHEGGASNSSPKLTKLKISGPKEPLRTHIASAVLSPHEVRLKSLQNIGSWKADSSGPTSPLDIVVSKKSGDLPSIESPSKEIAPTASADTSGANSTTTTQHNAVSPGDNDILNNALDKLAHSLQAAPKLPATDKKKADVKHKTPMSR